MPFKIFLIAILCHIGAGTHLSCHRETVWQGEVDDADDVCDASRSVITQWKLGSKFASNEWAVLAYQCKAGTYIT